MYYVVTYLFLLISSKGSFLYFSNIYWFGTDLLLLWVGLEKGRFSKSDLRLLLTFSTIYITFCTLRSAFLTHLPLGFWISDVEFLLKFILTGFLYCVVLKEKAIYYLTKVIVQLAIISIPLYFMQLLSGDLFPVLGRLFNFPTVYPGTHYTNFLVFTYVAEHATRNSGFSWEPGAFGFFLNMGLFLHLLSNNFVFDRKAKWLAFAILTTISTTSYLALAVIVFCYFRARGVKLTTLMVLFVPVFFILALQLPFFFQKISMIYNADSTDMTRVQFLTKWYLQRGEQMPLNRFGSALYLYQIFGVKLIWGVSNIYEETAPILRVINISNGIFDFLAMYGIIGLVFFLYRCFIFFRKFTESIELSIYGLILILILAFSESVFSIPFLLCFLFLYDYAQPEVIGEEVPLAVSGFAESDEEYRVPGDADLKNIDGGSNNGRLLRSRTVFGKKINLKLKGQ